MGGKVKIAKLNIDENPELAAQFGVRSIPTLMIFKAGEVADMKVGAAPKTALSALDQRRHRLILPSRRISEARPSAGLFAGPVTEPFMALAADSRATHDSP